jgi:hypothetical protein
MENSATFRIELEELEETWGFKASLSFRKNFEKLNLNYRKLTPSERDQAIIKTVDTLTSEIAKVGPHRNKVWEHGWGENLEEYQSIGGATSIIPKYFGKIPEIRWKQEWILPESPKMEYEFLGLLLQYVFEKFVRPDGALFEFGCGTGHNLIRAREFYPDLELVGLDWAKSSQEIIQEYADSVGDKRFKGLHFDYFNPNFDIALGPNSTVITVASLEQTGQDYKKFIDYIQAKSPRLVIHIEPMWEPLDQTDLLDYLSTAYFRKRGYLDGLSNHIQGLEQEGRAKVVEFRRTFTGSFFIDGYSLLVWKPI